MSNELFPLNVKPYVSSLGRRPSPRIVEHFPSRLTGDDGLEAYDNQWLKWAGRGVIGVFKATENIVEDPENLTTANWANVNSTDVLSGYYFRHCRFTKIISSANAGQIRQDVSFTGDGVKAISILLKKGTTETDSAVILWDVTASASCIRVLVNWSTETATGVIGTLVEQNWYGFDIVELLIMSTTVTAASTNQLLIRPSYAGTGELYVTAVQAEDSIYPTPYTPTERAAGALDFSKSMPNQGTLEGWVRGWFDADTTGYPMVFSWATDVNNRFELRYNPTSNEWVVLWKNGGTERHLLGTTVYTNTTLWNWIHLKVTWNISAGTGALAVNGVTEDATWSGPLDAFTTPIENLSIGLRGYNNTHHFDGLFNDFAIKDTVDVSNSHYNLNRPYYVESRVLGKNGHMMVDQYGNAIFGGADLSLVSDIAGLLVDHEEAGDVRFG